MPDAPLDQPALAVDQLQLHQTGQELDMIQALGRALLGDFLVFPQEGGQLQPLQVGTKWKVKRSWRPSQARTLACLWAA